MTLPAASAELGADKVGLAVAPLTDLAVGRVVRGMVQSANADGSFTLVLGGRAMRAVTDLPLIAGDEYEFVVTARTPSVVLALTQPAALTWSRALVNGLLGSGIGELTAALAAWIGAIETDARQSDGAAMEGLRGWLERFAAGRATGADLAAFHRASGHDHEARILQLSGEDADGAQLAAAELRATLKAHALQALARAPMSGTSAARAAAGAVVHALNEVEAENARRKDSGGFLVLPLPSVNGGWLRDARLFLRRGEPDGGWDSGAVDDAPFTIVLLLDLSSLGPVRVDVELRGKSVGVVAHVATDAAERRLRAALPDLDAELSADGLPVRCIALRRAGPGGPPISDLVAPRWHRDPARVDVHA